MNFQNMLGLAFVGVVGLAVGYVIATGQQPQRVSIPKASNGMSPPSPAAGYAEYWYPNINKATWYSPESVYSAGTTNGSVIYVD